MRGIAAIALALAFLIPVLALSAFNASSNALENGAQNQALALEEMRGLDLSFKNAFAAALADSAAPTRREAITLAASRLRSLELILEKDSRVQVWFGSATKEELDALPGKMLEEGAPLKCADCWDLDAAGLGWEDEPLPLAAALLDFRNGRVVVSRNGANLFKTPPPISGEAGFGLSYYDGSRAAVYFVNEGYP